MAATRAEDEWLVAIQAQVVRGGLATAQPLLLQALAEHPASVALRRARAGALHDDGRDAEAELLLRALLVENGGDAASAFALARMLKEQGRMAAAASIVRECLARPPNHGDANLAIQALELLDDANRKADAANIAEMAIHENPDDPRLHAYAGMLQIQLGAFDEARRHYLFALQHDERAWEWHVPIGLSSAQRYMDDAHPDFARFREGLQRERLSGKPRAEVHFALGKALDDLGDYERATCQFRDGNAIAHHCTRWTRKGWRRVVEARLAAKPITTQAAPTAGFMPVFIVGMPRSGTTLVAELLSRHPGVCNRGELPWLARLAERPDLSGEPTSRALERAAASYVAQSRQDDVGDARCFIDKQPLNFRYVDLMLALFPDARIVHCQRGARDTALSLWMQCFREDVQGYAYDFGDISLVMRDCERLMARWGQRHPDSIRTVRYEDLVADADTVIGALSQWIGMPATQTRAPTTSRATSSISTASLWQARQPVNARSVGRWRHYAPHVPELLQFPA